VLLPSEAASVLALAGRARNYGPSNVPNHSLARFLVSCVLAAEVCDLRPRNPQLDMTYPRALRLSFATDGARRQVGPKVSRMRSNLSFTRRSHLSN
jgi:hypothetical protein